MTLEQLGNVGEVIAALATTLTLLYLAVQIRQNSKALRASSIAAYMQAQERVSTSLAENKELCELHFKGMQTPELLTESERRRFFIVLGNYVMALTLGDQMESAGVLPTDLQHHYSVQLDWLVCQPGFAFWRENWGGILPPGFADRVDALLIQETDAGRAGMFRDYLDPRNRAG